MTGFVIIVPANEAETIRSRPADRQPTLQELQDIVDGYIEAVPHWDSHMGEPAVAYCNEDGKARELPVNQRATRLWWAKLGGPVDDVLCGDVVVVVNLPDPVEEA